MRDILQVYRDTLFCDAPSVERYPASLCGLELPCYKDDRDLRCLPSLRRVVLDRNFSESVKRDPGVFRLPAELACLAIYGAGDAILDASSCSEDLLIMADHRIHVEFVGQDKRKKGACQPRVMRLHPYEVCAWIDESLGCDTEYHKW